VLLMKRVSTGIVGLDEMLGGGFPQERVILVRGGPGSGKTIFSLQFIVEGVKRGERGIYVTLEEPLNSRAREVNYIRPYRYMNSRFRIGEVGFGV